MSDERAVSGAVETPASTISPRAWWAAVLYIASLALFLRFYDLPLKPLHHDEGVNAYLLTKLVRPPHSYHYDPSNYHGPTLYYFGWASVSAVGLNTAALRLVTACAGLAVVLLPLVLRRELGDVGSLTAAAILASSSGAVYYSRYFIHESILVCCTLAVVAFAALWRRTGHRAYAYLAAVSAGVMFATKETAFISAVVIAGSALMAMAGAAYAESRDRRADHRSAVRDTWAKLAGVAASLDRRHVRLLIEAGITLAAVALLFYTSLFTDRSGALAAVRTFAIWTKTGRSEHTQPWYSYLEWLAIEELPLLVAGSVGVGFAILYLQDRFAAFAAIWAVGMLAAYSLIPYKTPWLLLNTIVPLSLCAGYASDRLWRGRSRGTLVWWVLFVAAVGASTYRAGWLSFWHYDDDRSPYVYAHTSREVLRLVSVVDEIAAANSGISIGVTSRQYFPLPWYLRDYRTGFHGGVRLTGDPIVIGSLDQRAELDSLLEARYERLGPYRLRPGVRLLVYVRRDVKRPGTAY